MKRHRHLGIEALEKREVLSATVLEVEVNDSKPKANPFSLDPADGSAKLIGSADGKEDRDFFVFTAGADGMLDVRLESTNGKLAELQVEDVRGTQWLEINPKDEVQSGSIEVNVGQTYFVRLRSIRDLAADYVASLSMDRRVGGSFGGTSGGSGGFLVVEQELNDHRASATRFSLDTDACVELQGVSKNQKDKDYFVFTSSNNTFLVFNVRSHHGTMAKVEIEDRFGRPLTESDPYHGINSGAVKVETGGQYFLRVRSTSELPADYSVDVFLTDAPSFGEPKATGRPGDVADDHGQDRGFEWEDRDHERGRRDSDNDRIEHGLEGALDRDRFHADDHGRDGRGRDRRDHATGHAFDAIFEDWDAVTGT